LYDLHQRCVARIVVAHLYKILLIFFFFNFFLGREFFMQTCKEDKEDI